MDPKPLVVVVVQLSLLSHPPGQLTLTPTVTVTVTVPRVIDNPPVLMLHTLLHPDQHLTPILHTTAISSTLTKHPLRLDQLRCHDRCRTPTTPNRTPPICQVRLQVVTHLIYMVVTRDSHL